VVCPFSCRGVFCILIAPAGEVNDGGIWFGVALGGLIITLILPAGSGLIYMVNTPGFGWMFTVHPIFLILDLGFVVPALGFFRRVLRERYRAAPRSAFGKESRKLLVALALGLSSDVLFLGAGC